VDVHLGLDLLAVGATGGRIERNLAKKQSKNGNIMVKQWSEGLSASVRNQLLTDQTGGVKSHLH
jgi:hypothetical protein